MNGTMKASSNRFLNIGCNRKEARPLAYLLCIDLVQQQRRFPASGRGHVLKWQALLDLVSDVGPTIQDPTRVLCHLI